MKENTNRYPLYQRVLSFAMAALIVFGVLPLDTRAATTAEAYTVEHIATVADPQTIGRPGSVYGDNTLNAGKVTVGKSVHDGAVTITYGGNKSQTFTPAENNFIITLWIDDKCLLIGIRQVSRNLRICFGNNSFLVFCYHFSICNNIICLSV